MKHLENNNGTKTGAGHRPTIDQEFIGQVASENTITSSGKRGMTITQTNFSGTILQGVSAISPRNSTRSTSFYAAAGCAPLNTKRVLLSGGERLDQAASVYKNANFLDTRNKNQFFTDAREVCQTKDAKKYGKNFN